MANEAFALSPISARAASPTDADFDAIREAFLETARGRWFLDEYTRRNRNADTAMVLEAVARIEHTLAAQKEEQKSEAEPAVTAPSTDLPEAMAAVRAIVTATRESVSAVLADQVLADALAPSRKCARVIREIAWGLRESGADGRICALLESQVDAINAACDHAMATDLRADLMRAFDRAARDIDSLVPATAETHDETPPVAIQIVDFNPPPAETAGEPQNAAPDDERFCETAVAFENPAPESSIVVALPAGDIRPAELVTAVAIPDEVPEQIEAVDFAVVSETAEQTVLENESAALAIEREADVAMSMPASLGASLIANGIVTHQVSPRSDPLAPIRRMSQAEKIAFFS